jgi:hypothetical protein
MEEVSSDPPKQHIQLAFSEPTNTIYFKGDCRTEEGNLRNMFQEMLSDYEGTAALTGNLISIMGGENITIIPESLAENTFRHTNLSSIPDELLKGISGVPAENMFHSTFYDNQLTSIPADLFSKIEGAPAEYMLYYTFASNTHLSYVGDLGMNITSATDMLFAYYAMLAHSGEDESVTEITIANDSLISLFTEPGAPFASLDDLYSGTSGNGETNNAFPSDWRTKYKAEEISDFWIGDPR